MGTSIFDSNPDEMAAVICRIVVSLRPGIVRQAIIRELESRDDVAIFDCSDSDHNSLPHEFDVASQLRVLLLDTDNPDGLEITSEHVGWSVDRPSDAIAVITDIDMFRSVPSEISRWLVEFPELIVIGIHSPSGKIYTFRQTIEVRESGDSLSTIVAAIERFLKSREEVRIS